MKDVTSLEEKTSELDKLIKNIEKVSDEMQTISINASIQAGRVGQIGKPFAVVAKEMQKLTANIKEQAALEAW